MARRTILQLLLLAFALLTLYSYANLVSLNTLGSQLEGVFLLNLSLCGVMALLYSLARNLSFLGNVSNNLLAYDLRIPVVIIAGSTAVSLYYAYHTFGSDWLFIPLPALLVFTVLVIRGVYPLKGTTRIPSSETIMEEKVVKLVAGKDRLRLLAEYRAKRFSSLLAKSGVIGNPYLLAASSVRRSFLAAIISIPAALAFGLLVWYPILLLAIVPGIIYVAPELRLKDRAGERRVGVERELPFFSILVNVLGSAGVPLYTIFVSVANTKIFKFIRNESLLIKRDVTIFGTNPIESFENLASYHPSRKFASFLYGYTSKVRSGGDIPSYLLGESGTLLRALEETWNRYSSRAGIIGSMMITIFGVIPMILLIVGIFSPATSIIDLTIFALLGVPTFTVMLVFMASRMQPVGEEPLVGNPKRSLVLAAPGLVLGLLTREAWLGAASTLFLFLTVYGFSVVKQQREMREMEEALPEFTKDLMEFKRQDYDLTRSILAIAAHNRYTSSFDKVLSGIAAQLRVGTPLNEVTVDPKSKLARLVLFVLGQMGHSGGGTVETVYQLSTYTTRVVEMKKNTKAEMRPYVLLSYFSPVMIAFGVTFISGVLNSFSSLVQPGLASIHVANLAVGTVPSQLREVSNLLIVVSSAALGIIGAKMLDLTVKNTLRASMNVMLATSVAYLFTQINITSLLHLTP
ncbi:MAG: type II secretion system F family protein [Thaumarchaeota archaeon]|nr:type II secretion system F family protein [Nitrososphaerota archaeon]